MGRANRSREQIADAVAYVCENAGPLRASLAGSTAEQHLDELLAALRDGTDPAELLESVHRGLRQAGDALGVFGRNRDATTLAGLERNRFHEPVLLCPRAAHACTRFAWPDHSAVCAVTGSPLRRATLP
ncbi:hypothetical protein [Amycolatopsis sp.]|uniref:hypothetical protein n=1 Tax=Amycolatopsis sp. TaxID=37632 RepID=UPI002BAA5908|nr:hypothetical protein [Amycolatopsis sp.]HVV11951.1 hypothetical protein [Amycolatopsis sp.]